MQRTGNYDSAIERNIRQKIGGKKCWQTSMRIGYFLQDPKSGKGPYLLPPIFLPAVLWQQGMTIAYLKALLVRVGKLHFAKVKWIKSDYYLPLEHGVAWKELLMAAANQ